jgi:hypothetical protein
LFNFILVWHRSSFSTSITRAGKVIWSAKAPNVRYPSVAFPTLDGKQVIVDDFWKPGRVVIFDPATRKLTWQYGEKGKKGFTPGLLNYPDGVDLDVFRDWKAALKK